MVPRELKIAIDFDDTITADPLMFKFIIAAIKASGHIPFIVTYREDSEGDRFYNDKVYNNKDVEQFAKETELTVYYTSKVQKREYMASLGVFPDIWMDDKPEAICNYKDCWNFS